MTLILSDQLQGFRLYVTSNDPENIDSTDLVYRDNSTPLDYQATNGIYTLITGHNGQFVHIEVPKKSILVLCEVEVFEGNTNYYYYYYYYFFFFFFFFFFLILYILYHCTITNADYLSFCITKTRLNNFDPFKPHFYTLKRGFTGVYIIFLISAQRHRLWVLIRTASSRRF